MMAKKVNPVIGLVTCSSEFKRSHKLLEEKLFLAPNYNESKITKNHLLLE